MPDYPLTTSVLHETTIPVGVAIGTPPPYNPLFLLNLISILVPHSRVEPLLLSLHLHDPWICDPTLFDRHHTPYIAFLLNLRSQVARQVLQPLFRRIYPPSHNTTRNSARNIPFLTSLVTKMKATVLLATLLAAPLSVIADDVIVWTTVVEWVGPGGTPIAAPNGGSQAVGNNPDNNKAVEHPNAVATPSTSAAPPPPPPPPPSPPAAGAVGVNEKLAIPGGGQQDNQQQQQQQQPATSSTAPATSSSAPVSSSPPAASSPPPSGGSTGGPSGGGGFDSQSCTGSGMNIFWTGDEVDYTIKNGASGTTKGCLNLGEFSSNIDIGGRGGTLFEGNWNSTGNQYFDISFITGFSVPVMCKASGGMSGCSIDLHSQGTDCPQPGGDKLCTNPVGMNGKHDPKGYTGKMAAEPWCYACSAPHKFFQPCSGAGYTYPYDDGATKTARETETINCCVGTSCGHTGREGSTKDGNPQPTRPGEPCTVCLNNKDTKRGLEAVMADSQPMTPSLLPRKHKRHQHRHAAVHEAKARK